MADLFVVKMGADHVLLMIQNLGLSPLSTLNYSITIAIQYGPNLHSARLELAETAETPSLWMYDL